MKLLLKTLDLTVRPTAFARPAKFTESARKRYPVDTDLPTDSGKDMKFAALDLGSNSFHLLVAEVGQSGELQRVLSKKEVPRLGAVVAAHGALLAPAFDAALKAMGTLIAAARSAQAERVVAVGTSALRDASNGQEFCRVSARLLGVPVELLSGSEEAQLVYLGARSGVVGLPDPTVVVDLGGGSVEVAIGEGTDCRFAASLPLGFLRLEHAVGSIGGGAERAIFERVFAETRALGPLLKDLRPAAWVFSGGTARALAKLVGSTSGSLSAPLVASAVSMIGQVNPSTLRKMGVDESRVGSIRSGAIVLNALLECLQIPEIRVSPHGLREGVILREFGRRAVAPTRLIA